MSRGRHRSHIQLKKLEEDWLLSRVAADEEEELSFSAAVREILVTHPIFREVQRRLQVDPGFKEEYEVLVAKGREIRRANKRR